MSGILTPDQRRPASSTAVFAVEGENRPCGATSAWCFGQRSQLWWDVPVIDSFELLRDIYQVETSAYRCNLEELTALLNLSEHSPHPGAAAVRWASGCAAKSPPLSCTTRAFLFLDEPTIGLDAPSKYKVRDLIRRINRDRGATVILTTHDMQDIEALASRILLIGKGLNSSRRGAQ